MECHRTPARFGPRFARNGSVCARPSILELDERVAEILNDFPYLTAEDIQACLAYAAERERGGARCISMTEFHA
ncbi:MAG: DUF433 domain-containing protein [Gemmataceae bacterium]|nr:DUF433 domain-containing protein [Gemmataceae bacterium]